MHLEGERRSSVRRRGGRPRVISTPALLGVVALVIVLLVMVFPREALIRHMTAPGTAESNDELAAKYGAGVLRTVPGHERLRAAVAERQVDIGDLPRARATLAPLRASADASVRRDAGRREHAILTEMLASGSVDSPAARQVLADLRTLLDQLAAEIWPLEQTLSFAREAAARGWSETAGRFYRRAAAPRFELAPAVVAEIVDHHIGRGDYRTGADIHFALANRARNPAERRAHYLAALAVLEAANRPGEAVTVGRAQLEDLLDDEIARAALVRLAVAAGDADTAAELHFSAQKRGPSLAARRERFLAGVTVLQSANRLADALAAADRNVGDLADDEETLLALTRLAVSANDPARAQTYARRLLRLQPLSGETMPRWLERLSDFLIATANAQATPEPLARPYSESAYRLAFDVFVANANFTDARRAAEAALAQRPDDAGWRERLARVCEWMGDAPEALRHWRMLAERGSDEAVQALLRLAPGLADDETLLYAWLRVARGRTLDAMEERNLADLFERTNRVDEGIAWFRERLGPNEPIAMLATIGELAARGGRFDAAIAAYERIAARDAMTVDHAIALATLRIGRGEFQRAFDTLERVRGLAGRGTDDYWRLFGDLAWQLGDDAAAARAYGELSARERLERFELARLLRIMRARQPLEAARLAEIAWSRSRDPQLFYVAVEIHAARRDLSALTRLFGSVELADEPRFRGDAYFFTLRAAWHAQRLRGRQAINDLKRALALRPTDPGLRSQYLWLVIDLREIDELRASLAAWDRDAQGDRTLWPAFAAGYQTSGEPQRALAYYRRALPEHKDDHLWLLGFADALADANQPDIAWRVRRHAWQAMRERLVANPERLRLPAQIVGYARLVAQFAPGDASLRVVRQAISQATTSSGNAPLDAATRELALAQSIGDGAFDQARAWLWLQYGRALAKPGWGELAIALATNDPESLDRLLSGDARGLPRYDRIDAARALDRLPLAQSLGWASLESYPNDDATHRRLEPDLRATSTSLFVQGTGFRYSGLRGTERSLGLDFHPRPDIRVTPYWRETDQHATDASVLVGIPATDRRVGMQLESRRRDRQVTLDLGERSAMRTFGTLDATWSERLSQRLGLRVDAGRNRFASETAATRIAATKDEARVTARWDTARREYVVGALGTARYHTQSRTAIGSGTRAEVESGYRIRAEYPDLVARIHIGHQWFTRSGTTDTLARSINPAGTVPDGSFFLPPSFGFYTAAIGFGQVLRETYSRGVRPFADASVSYNTVIGTGYGVLAGLAGSVLGADHLAFGVVRARGGATANTDYAEIFLRYRLHF